MTERPFHEGRRPAQRPEVSVVIPTRNRSRLLVLALSSVLRQRGVALEVLVVDDGSTDETPQVAGSIGDPRIRMIRLDLPQGVSRARNRGIAEATGEWLAFLDDDDLWAPDKLSAQLEAARATGSRWVYAGSVSIDEKNQVRGGSPPVPPARFVELLPRWNPMPGGCSNAIVRAEAIAAVGPFDPNLRILADWDQWLRVAAFAGPPACVPRALMAYRVHAANMSLDTERMVAELRMMEQRYGSSIDRAGFLRYMGRQALRSGQRVEALRLFARAARSDVQGLPGLAADLRLLTAHLLRSAHRRLHVPASGWAVRRLERARVRDPHRRWKDEARVWLGELTGAVAGGD